ncbi:MAG: hypothetical protein M3132_00600 [Actinomycetia bacterium]|nr:hypothetical protein [Actinomycetes bacterium]
MKRLSLFAAVMIFATACASAAPSETTNDSQATTAQTDSATEAPNTSDPAETPDASGEPQSSTAQTAEGPVAPDFTMPLADGGSFTLYDEQKPVYMIFWAEW